MTNPSTHIPATPGCGRAPAPASIVAAGAVCLAVIMGIGRFAYTSILPLMIAEGALDLAYGSTLASANYLGYLLGALGCVLIPNHWSSARLVRWSLVATVLLTAGMMLPLPGLWLGLRFLSGAVSGLALVHTSRWCLGAVARQGRAALGSAMFTGVGLGIGVSGLVASAMIAAHWTWVAAWGGFTLTAALLLALVWRLVDPATEFRPAPAVRVRTRGHRLPRVDLQLSLFTLAYGLAGFGYIITATYLPVIARSALPPSVWLDLFWPIYGLAAAIGSLAVTRLHGRFETRALLVLCHLMQATGVMLSTIWPSLPGFVLGAVIAGLPFTALNFLAMDEAARLQPHRTAQFIGLLTAAFAIGQIFGPPLVQVIMHHVTDPGFGFDLSLRIAGGALVVASGLYILLRRRYR
ncbi:YbfB/YjiJ family MFS transporter [Frigidibacter sp. MR17.24]|uniref:YbfB/YjiJ family MFS transporter n=1 Tax=Frigidibacter sp. MR17.24 TaxID=3127345 RepID=UPI003012E068